MKTKEEILKSKAKTYQFTNGWTFEDSQNLTQAILDAMEEYAEQFKTNKMKKLEFISGQGYSHSNEDGLFEVQGTETKVFKKLSQAKKYYESLNEEKAIWDITIIPELLECHIVSDKK